MNDFYRQETHLDRERLDALVGPVVRAHGGEVVDIEWKQEPGGWVLRVFIEKLGSGDASAAPPVAVSAGDAAISLDLCAGVARDLSPALDVADIIPHRYSLEVSSPGVERPLRDARDYVRFAGQKAKVRVKEPVDGQKVVVGVIELSDDPASIHLREGSRLRVISLDDVLSARLLFEFGPPPRPGKGHMPRKSAKPRKTKAASDGSSSASTSAPTDPERTSNS